MYVFSDAPNMDVQDQLRHHSLLSASAWSEGISPVKQSLVMRGFAPGEVDRELIKHFTREEVVEEEGRGRD